mmetsp:Transcript_40918/g.82049  ORF Transcript_40918/g.82049 Transcript_40918/m.82049 type:complete len:87 (-) Transcript_40918:120-380(-)
MGYVLVQQGSVTRAHAWRAHFHAGMPIRTYRNAAYAQLESCGLLKAYPWDAHALNMSMYYGIVLPLKSLALYTRRSVAIAQSLPSY